MADTTLRTVLRQIGLGRAAYYGWHLPRGKILDSIRSGGPLEQWRTRRGQIDMERAAQALPPLPDAPGPELVLHILTGKRFWYQTAFCLWTFGQHAKRTMAPAIYDDGSLTRQHVEALRRVFPRASFIDQSQTVARLERHLPQSRFPVLRERWLNYPNIRKLLDVHVGQSGWKLVVDSDLLFFRRPALLVAWLDDARSPLHAVDCETAYGYSRETMTRLAGAPVADLVNVGLTGLEGSSLDWARIEHWCRQLIEREGPHYYLEQALVAMLLAGRQCTVAPAEDYVTKPVPPQALECSAVMHHYVSNSKRFYFQHSWREAASRAGLGPDT